MRPLLLFLLLTVAAFNARAADVPMAGDTERARAVWATFETWLGAYERGDIDGVMAIFAPDVAFSWQGLPDQRHGELRKAYEFDFGARAPGSAWVPQVQEVYADGNLAFVRAHWEQVTTAADGTRTVTARNRSLDVLRRDADGQWRIFRSMNYPEKIDGGQIAK